MLSPDARQVATEILRPPAGYALDRTVMTTYSLDLEVVLALPLAVLAQSDQGVEELLADPLLLLEALREASGRVHVFVDEAGIALPRVPRELYAALEDSIHPVRAPGGGAFHPKAWVARFTREADGEPLLRIAIASRNLTFDRSWDVALVSEGRPGDHPEPGSQPLADLIRALPRLGRRPLADDGLSDTLEGLAEELGRTRFPAPEGFDGRIDLQVLGLAGAAGTLWQPVAEADRVLAVAPFCDRSGLDALAASGAKDLTLIGRDEALDALPEGTLAPWDVQVLQEAALEEPDDDTAGRPAGLHAKLIAAERGGRAHWLVGSANLTRAALSGRNVEAMAALSGAAGSADAERGVGIDRFRAGFDKLCIPYEPSADPDPAEPSEAQRALERARDRLLDADLAVHCEAQGDEWRWRLAGQLPEPAGVAIDVWPVTLPGEQARTWPEAPAWTLPIERLTAFVAFRLRSTTEAIDPLILVAKVPAHGLPEQRMHRILRTVINTPERFLAFLRALLGGLEELMAWTGEGDAEAEGRDAGAGLAAETLLEDLLRTAARDPERLAVVRHVISDLMADEAGSEVVPDEVYAIWQAVEAATQEGGG